MTSFSTAGGVGEGGLDDDSLGPTVVHVPGLELPLPFEIRDQLGEAGEPLSGAGGDRFVAHDCGHIEHGGHYDTRSDRGRYSRE